MPRPARLRRTAGSPTRPRLRVEPLEDRTVPSTISGTLYEDADGNGARDDGEPWLPAGMTVYLDTNANNLYDPGEATTLTDTAGGYTLPVPGPGAYTVGQVVPAGWLQTGPATAPRAGAGVYGEILTDVATPLPGTPTTGGGNNYVGVAWAGGKLYVVQGDTGDAPNTLSRLDPVTGTWTSLGTVPGQVLEFTYDAASNTFWGADVAADRALIQFDLGGTELRRIALTGVDVVGVEWDGDSLWVVDSVAAKLLDVDPATGQIVRTIAAPDTNALGVAFDGRSLWVTGTDADRVFEVRPSDGAVLRSLAVGGDFPLGLAFDGQALWSADHGLSRVVQYDLGVAPGRAVTVTSGSEAVTGVDFGSSRLGTASGQVYHDLNGNGGKDPGEMGLEGWRVFLDTNGNNQFDRWERYVLTDAAGSYAVGSLPPGEYRLAAELRQPGWTRTGSNTGTVTGSIAASGEADAGLDFSHRLAGLGPVGGEMRVNATTAGPQGQLNSVSGEGQVQSVAADGQGNYVVVWGGEGPGDSAGVFAQRYDRLGNKRGGEFRVNATVANGQRGPVAAMDPNGNFVVAWSTLDPATNKHAVFARAFAADGTPRTAGDVQVTPSSTRSTRFATSVAMDAAGNFVVLFLGSDDQGFSSNGGLIFFQRYNALGQSQGKATQVADASLINGSAAVGMDSKGNFVVTWSDIVDSAHRVFVQRYDAAGRKLGGQITSAVGYVRPSLARAADGTFVVASGGQIQVFNADGTPRTGAVAFGGTTGDGNRPALAIDGAGVVVAWQRDGSEVVARRYTLQGEPREAAFTVNTTFAGPQSRPSVAMTGSGGFVAAWSGAGPGDDAGVFAQRYTAPVPLTAISAGPSAAQAVTTEEVRSLAGAALDYWRTADPGRFALWGGVEVRVADLGGATLGLTVGDTVWVDDDAAGWGWFVDPTPRSDAEFRLPGDQGEGGRMDLLTVLVHEFGHLLGHDHEEEGAMAETLAPGVRLTPAPAGAGTTIAWPGGAVAFPGGPTGDAARFRPADRGASSAAAPPAESAARRPTEPPPSVVPVLDRAVASPAEGPDVTLWGIEL